MKKLFAVIFGVISMSLLMCVHSFAASNQLFLCMQADSSMAYQAGNDGLLDYIEMKDSGGAVATAKLIDGSTYLPFRYIAENAGLTDATGPSMERNTFKYESVGTGSITIVTKKGRYSQNVNVPFTFKMEDGTELEYKIVNIDGSLYFPMRYMAYLIGGYVDWAQSTGNIYFMTDEKLAKEFLTGKDGDKAIKYSKMAYINGREYDNTLGYSDIYLRSDGTTVSSVYEEVKNSNLYYSVTRARKNLYFTDENYNVYTKKEGENATEKISFHNTKNDPINPLVLNIISYQNKLYGIEIPDASSGAGRIFKADLDGENYQYISDADCAAYNILLREYDGQGYIFYVDAANNVDIHRINLASGRSTSDVKLTLRDTNGVPINRTINIMSLNNDKVIISELDDQKIDIIYLLGSVYTDSDITGYINCEIKEVNRATPIAKIQSLNYDTDNDLFYFINDSGKNYGLYCCDPVTSRVYSISTSQGVKRRISIIKMSENLYRIYHYTNPDKNEYSYTLVSVGDDGSIKIGTDIEVKR